MQIYSHPDTRAVVRLGDLNLSKASIASNAPRRSPPLRGERFNDGLVDGQWRKGPLARIVERLGEGWACVGATAYYL